MRLTAPLSLAGAALALALASAAAAAAPLTNGDFSAGFAYWQGEVRSCTVCDGTDDAVVALTDPADFGAYADNFSTGTDGATLASSFFTDGVYNVALFQELDVGPLAGRFTGVELSFDLDYQATVPVVEIFAQLSDPNGVLPTLSLFDGSPVDITAYAGQSAELLFAVDNFFGAGEDSLTIGAVRIDQVPVPTPLTLLAAGLGLLAVRRRRRLTPHQASTQE
jgi:hypothetical protein